MKFGPVRNKKSSVTSWLGFGIAITVFALIWIVNMLVFQQSGQPANGIDVLYLITILLGILAMAFSVIGLVLALKNGTPKWIGVSGIALCVASIISIFVPTVCSGFIQKEPVKIVLPQEAKEPDYAIEIFISKNGKLECTDVGQGLPAEKIQIDGDDSTPLRKWMESLGRERLKQLKNDGGIGVSVKADNEADYADLVVVLDLLQEMKISKFTFKSADPIH